MNRFLILSMFFPLAGLAEAPPASGLLAPNGLPISEPDRTILEKGELLVELTEVTDTGTKKAVAVGLIDALPEDVFLVLTDYNSFTSFMPYCKTVQVKESEDQKSSVYFALDFPWPIGDRHYVLNLTDSSDDVSGTTVYTSSWTYEKESGNIKDSHGSWEVRAYDGKRSFVRYTVFTDPGGSIPAWANNAATEIAIPKVFKGLRAQVQSKGGDEEKK
ncbi:MAG: SRPBCC family protein [Candidatus Hydrogenedentes bacterium]|nr:SRPBCC family protein [Candidatus Hydrogenedentota bacterium]